MATKQTFWGVKLTGQKRANETEWSPKLNAGIKGLASEELKVSQVALGPDTDKHPVTVQVTCGAQEGMGDGTHITCAICTLTPGRVEQCSVELIFAQDVKFSIVGKGKGPVYISGCVVTVAGMDDEADDDEMMEEDSEDDDEEAPTLTPIADAIIAKAEADDESDDEEDEEEDDDMEDDEEDESDDESEEEETKPQVKAKAPAPVKKTQVKAKAQAESEDESDDEEDDEEDDDEEDESDDESEEDDDESDDESEEEETKPQAKAKAPAAVKKIVETKSAVPVKASGTKAGKKTPVKAKAPAAVKKTPVKAKAPATNPTPTTPAASSTSVSIQEMMKTLLKSPNAPKKQSKFVNFCKKTLKVEDEKDIEKMWQQYKTEKKL